MTTAVLMFGTKDLASAATAASPAMKTEGTPCQPARAELRPNSPVSRPFIQTPSIAPPEIVWASTPFSVPFIAW